MDIRTQGSFVRKVVLIVSGTHPTLYPMVPWALLTSPPGHEVDQSPSYLLHHHGSVHKDTFIDVTCQTPNSILLLYPAAYMAYCFTHIVRWSLHRWQMLLDMPTESPNKRHRSLQKMFKRHVNSYFFISVQIIQKLNEYLKGHRKSDMLYMDYNMPNTKQHIVSSK